MMWRLCVLALIATASAQIPSLGWCPDYQPMANFNMNRFLGTWYEAERYFTVSELGSRCVTTKYEQTPEGRILVSNEITNSLTGMKRVMDGHLQVIGREGEGRIIVKYSSLPVPFDNEFSILDTDYDNYAVMWSCSGIGPVHTQNAWVLTRDRLANMQIMQSAYGVLDRFKISRAFFLKTNQADCNVLPDPAADPIAAKSAVVDVVAKNVPQVAEKIEHIVEKKVDPEVKLDAPQEKQIAPEKLEEEQKPLQVPELILSESAEKIDLKLGEPLKDLKPEIPEIPEKNEEKPPQ
ncbi:apolipoprotein D-like [Cydia amplana]|uniref:apolipoprotein D-like n=1 Tax=Cydia amplana TaxID=1869771 RepID=UPI002FE64D08